MHVLTLNCGSSSVKYQRFDWTTRRVLARGLIERIGDAGTSLTHRVPGEAPVRGAVDVADHEAAVLLALESLRDPELSGPSAEHEIAAVGHRVVHGGEHFRRSVIVGFEALQVLRALSHLAPLHNPVNLDGITAAQLLLPDAVHCAIFDTAWHQTMPPQAYRYAVPQSWHDDLGVRRYGFHGTSFLYVARRCAALLGRPAAETNLVLFHVGHGASANAVAGGASVDTSMGMTPLEGLVMGTRCGDLDPAVPFHVMEAMDRPPHEIEVALQRKSGVLGLAGVADRREVERRAAGGDERAVLALDVEGYRLRKYLGAYAAVLGRLDAVAFTGGAGEMSPTLRERALAGLEVLGIELDPERNRRSRTHHGETRITTDDSPVPVFVVPTDEERVMAEDAVALVERRYDLPARFRYSFEDPEFVDEERCGALQAELAADPALADLLVSC